MRTVYLRWILPILALLIMATVLVIAPAVMGHAEGTKTETSKPIIHATATPTYNIKPNVYWHN